MSCLSLASSYGPSLPTHLRLSDLLKHLPLFVVRTQVAFPAPLCASVSPLSQKHFFNSSPTYEVISFSRMSYFSSLPREFQLFLYDPEQMSLSLRSLCRFLQRALQLLFCIAITVFHVDPNLTGELEILKGKSYTV